MKEPEKVKLTQAEGEALIERINASDLVGADRRILAQLIHMYFWLMFALQETKLSLKRLKALLFGRSSPVEAKSEPKEPGDKSRESEADNGQEPESNKSPESEADKAQESEANKAQEPEAGKSPKPEAGKSPEPEADKSSQESQGQSSSGEEVERDAAGRRKRGGGKPRGQGRYGADAYTGAQRVLCQLDPLQLGQLCPACERGTLYRLPPGVEIRLDGNGFLTALRYELEKLRCSACGQVYTAPLPEEAGEEKYSDQARAVLALGRYYLGVPFYRLEKYQQLVGAPVADATQWDQVERLAGCVWPVFNELVYQAAQAERLHEDDTGVRVLSLIQENAGPDTQARRGMYTTGLVAMAGEHEIWLYFNGRANAGENTGAVVQLREPARGQLILMSDALSANELEPPPPGEVIKCFCLAHGVRKFSEIEEAFPQPCRYVLEILEAVFEHERISAERGLSDEERLAYHQRHSAPLMQALHEWLEAQIENREVEPNSSLGKALNYLRNHWTELTQFLRVGGAPLDNNVAERALKLMIRQRRNSLFFASAYSAGVASMLCSVIATAMNAGVNVVEYLVVLQQRRAEVMERAHQWLPWNYQANLIPP